MMPGSDAGILVAEPGRSLEKGETDMDQKVRRGSPVCVCGGLVVRLMADYCSSGLWCQTCGLMLDPDDLALPQDLQEAIAQWILNWDHATLTSSQIPPMHNQRGLVLAQQLVRYVPCTLFIEPDRPC